MRNKMDGAVVNDDGNKRKRFTMIQRDSPPIRRDESMEDILPDDFNQHSPPLSNQISPPTATMSSQSTMAEHAPPPYKKSRGRPQKQYWTHEWSDRATEALIELWSEKEELYNKQHPLFYVKESKDRAVDNIRDSLHEKGFDVTSNNILSKFQSLRTYFCTQRTKHTPTTRRTNGSGSRYVVEEGECKWRFYKSLMFLDDNMKPRDSHRKMEMMKSEYKGDYSSPPSFTMQYESMGGQMGGPMYREYDSPAQQAPNEYIHHELVPESNGYHNNHTNNHNESSLDGMASKDCCLTTSSGEEQQKTPTSTNITPVANSKHEDFIFGDLVGNMIYKLSPGKHKDLIKLEIQQLIIKAKYASNSNDTVKHEKNS